MANPKQRRRLDVSLSPDHQRLREPQRRHTWRCRLRSPASTCLAPGCHSRSADASAIFRMWLEPDFCALPQRLRSLRRALIFTQNTGSWSNSKTFSSIHEISFVPSDLAAVAVRSLDDRLAYKSSLGSCVTLIEESSSHLDAETCSSLSSHDVTKITFESRGRETERG